MANNLIGVSIDELPEVKKLIRDLPVEVHDAVGSAVAVFVLNKLQAQPPPKYVTRTAAYGTPFFTDKQRRWFFASLNDGTLQVPYRRTQGLRKSWQTIGEGMDTIIVSEADAAVWTMSDDMQSRHEALVGWKRVSDILRESSGRITEIASGAIKKAMKALGTTD